MAYDAATRRWVPRTPPTPLRIRNLHLVHHSAGDLQDFLHSPVKTWSVLRSPDLEDLTLHVGILAGLFAGAHLPPSRMLRRLPPNIRSLTVLADPNYEELKIPAIDVNTLLITVLRDPSAFPKLGRLILPCQWQSGEVGQVCDFKGVTLI